MGSTLRFTGPVLTLFCRGPSKSSYALDSSFDLVPHIAQTLYSTLHRFVLGVAMDGLGNHGGYIQSSLRASLPLLLVGFSSIPKVAVVPDLCACGSGQATNTCDPDGDGDLRLPRLW